MTKAERDMLRQIYGDIVSVNYFNPQASLIPLLDEIETLEAENAKLKKIDALKSNIINRFPFCPDCRDKVQGDPCYRCENHRLRAALEEAGNDIHSEYCGTGHHAACARVTEALERK